MKKPILFLTALCSLLTACEDVEKKANEKLQLARQAYEAKPLMHGGPVST